MSYKSDVKNYLKEFEREYLSSLSGGQHTKELSFRVPLHNLFVHISNDLNPSGEFDVILEPSNQGKVGRPDWRIQNSRSLGIYGYVEAKGPSLNRFDISPYKDQIERYLSLGHKLVITDGIDFVFCFNEHPKYVSLIDKNKLKSHKNWSSLPINPEFKLMMTQFFQDPSPQQLNEEKLVELIALRTRNLSDQIYEKSILSVDEAIDNKEEEVIKLLDDLKLLIYDHNDSTMKTNEVFSDFVAQIIMFCLLFAHRTLCNQNHSPKEKERIIREFAFSDLAKNDVLYPFRQLMVYLRDNDKDDSLITQWINECILFLSFVTMTDKQLNNPDYHKLFELFLAKFDKNSKFDFGAFYTPGKLAAFIVGLTNLVVEDSIGASIFNEGNLIIDPCCGTGSFLEQIIRQDHTDLPFTLVGIEILPAPYMLANYRMDIIKDIAGRKNISINIFLANTLCNYMLGEIPNVNSIEGYELKRASDITSKPIQLIIGNPPCSDSRDKTGVNYSILSTLLDDFRPPKTQRRGRQNIQKQVNNPFMQFLRWSCYKLFNSNEHAALSFIVPSSFLDGESYKYARKYLCEHFTHLWVVLLDLDSRTGASGNGLFNTMQGRALIVLTKKIDENKALSEFLFSDISNMSTDDKYKLIRDPRAFLNSEFCSLKISDNTFAFIPEKNFDKDLYSMFWPITNEDGIGIYVNQCSGAKLAPTSLLTHVKKPILIRRTKEILKSGYSSAVEWINGQDKKITAEKVSAFVDAFKDIKSQKEMNRLLDQNIVKCSFRPFVTSNALIWNGLYISLKKLAGGGMRIRPEIKNVFEDQNTIGFAVAHAPKDVSSTLERFASFCWHFPDNDLSRRGNGHIYLNQYCQDKNIKNPAPNINADVLAYYSNLTGLSDQKVSSLLTYYCYSFLCSRVYLDEFYGALFIVNQSNNRPRIPLVKQLDDFIVISEIGKKLAEAENDTIKPSNILNIDYNEICGMLSDDFRLSHSRSASKSNFDSEKELLILRDENSNKTIEIPCPLEIQNFNISGYNILKDCWIKFNSYRYTRCVLKKDDLIELMDLLNRIAVQMRTIPSIDSIMRDIVERRIELLEPF